MFSGAAGGASLNCTAALRCMMSDRYRSSTRGIPRFEFW
jgi:hypothetical protein